MIIQALGRDRITVDALAELTGASAVTIRRDLADLEGLGQLRRVHGGAVRQGSRGNPMPYAVRSQEDQDRKALLAERVAELVGEDESVVLDGGTTTDAVARALVGRPLTVLCMSLHAASALGADPATRVIVPGGPVIPGTLAATAAAAQRAALDFRADLAVLGACAASPPHGLTTSTWDDAQTKRSLVACAARRLLVANGAKLERTSSFRFAAVDQLDDLVTTSDANPVLLGHFRERGVRVHTVRV